MIIFASFVGFWFDLKVFIALLILVGVLVGFTVYNEKLKKKELSLRKKVEENPYGTSFSDNTEKEMTKKEKKNRAFGAEIFKSKKSNKFKEPEKSGLIQTHQEKNREKPRRPIARPEGSKSSVEKKRKNYVYREYQ